MSKVYSTELGKLCPDCGNAINNCSCKAGKIYPAQELVTLSRETKGRKGKGVTLVSGIGGSEADLKTIAKKLKQKCNSGGSVKNGVIEIQGDHREQLKTLLEELKFSVKISGG